MTAPSLLQVEMTISPLPALNEEDELLCHFGESPPQVARVKGDMVACYSPNKIPPTLPGQGEPHPHSHGTFHRFILCCSAPLGASKGPT